MRGTGQAYDDYPGYQQGNWREPGSDYPEPRQRRQAPKRDSAKKGKAPKGKTPKSKAPKNKAASGLVGPATPGGPATPAASEPDTRALRFREPESETRILKAGTSGQPHGARRTVKRRVKAVPVVAVASAFVVLAAVGTTAYYRLGPGRPNGNGVAGAFNAITNSKALAVLDEERQTIASMNSAVNVTSTTAKVSDVSPASVESTFEQDQQAAQEQETILAGELSPSQAMQVAQELMPSYGFSVSSQWSCLDDIWTRESGWEWDAENASSGAYGIPQSLPADKMATVASDYMTDATTQIKWGLGYIKDTYGSPCAAWDFELDNGFY
jgi:hypothetical protein